MGLVIITHTTAFVDTYSDTSPKQIYYIQPFYLVGLGVTCFRIFLHDIKSSCHKCA